MKEQQKSSRRSWDSSLVWMQAMPEGLKQGAIPWNRIMKKAEG